MRWHYITSLLLLPTAVLSFKNYQADIPNGGLVPHPCKPNYLWQGVGHQNPLGGGARNPFGVAFQAANKVWTKSLCQADSDGDGKSNGEELGDPDCIWTKDGGVAPSKTTGLTHPGVYEPTVENEQETNGWDIDCSDGANFTCDDFSDPDLVEVPLTFDSTLVPEDETSYFCQKFTIPDDQVYHVIATKPIIDNAYVMHHTIIYGCPEDIEGYDTPTSCDMAQGKCNISIGGWTVGSNGQCYHKDAGVRVGKGIMKTILIEHHWNNPLSVKDYYDASGSMLYLTPNLRKYNLGVMTIGQMNLNLAPQIATLPVPAVCGGACTKRLMNQTAYITTANLHMHYLGVSGSIEQWRDGKLVKVLSDNTVYSYDSPEYIEYSNPVALLPGDELRTNCIYSTVSRSEVTTYGEATSDEMCFGFLWFYPLEAMKDMSGCISYDDADMCDIIDYYQSIEDWLRRSSSARLTASLLVLVAVARAIL